MNIVKKDLCIGLTGFFLLMIAACTVEIGSDQWCANMKEKPKADWSVREVTDFAKYCILK